MAKGRQAFKKATQTPPHGALRQAALTGNPTALKNLLARGARVDETNDEGETPLMAAASAGSKECVQLLIDAGADVNVKDNGGDTPLIVAVDKDSSPCVDLLLKHGAKVDEKRADGLTPLITAIQHHRAEIALLLVSKGAKVDQESPDGEPALIHAAAQGSALNAVSIALLNKGAVVDSFGPSGITPLICAAHRNNVALAQFLIKKGADLDKGVGGITPLEFAVKNDSDEVAEVIREAYAERRRLKEKAIEKSAEGFSNGTTKPFTANKPLSFKLKP